MKFTIVNPETLGAPRGYSHGVLAPCRGRLLFVAGQPGWTRPVGRGATVAGPPDFAEQFGRALDRVLAVIREAGGEPKDVARMTVYVTDLEAYKSSLKALGAIWRARFGAHYPAMALLEVKRLVDEGAVVEVEATALVSEERP